MAMHASRIESRLLATAAMGLALAATVPYQEARAADICLGGGLTTINTAQANADNCILSAGESVDIQAAGSIPFTGADDAIIVPSSTAAGSITNAGTVSSTTQAIELRTSSSLSGGINNSGSLTSGIAPVIASFNGANVANGITNSGTIDGMAAGINITLTSSVTDGITNTDTGNLTVGGPGIIVDGSSVTGGITNQGTLTSTGAQGIRLNGGGSVTGGITNSSTGTIDSDASGIAVNGSTVDGGITNQGNVTSQGSHGIGLDGGGSISNGITNTGTITANAAGGFGILIDPITVTGGITNEGSITSSNDGIRIRQSATSISGGITNSSTGIIDSDASGIRLISSMVTGDITNAGTIDGGNEGIYVEAGAAISGSIANADIIDGGTHGIRLEDSGVGGITNAAGASITGGVFSVFIANPNAPVTIANAGFLDGEVQLNNGTLNLNGSSSRVDGVISGLATSTVNVNGDFTTEDTISVGTLAIATSGRLTLNHDVTLATGFNNTGTVAIADGATRTVTGDYTQTGNGTLEIGASSTASFGKLVVSGVADFSASDKVHVNVGAANSFALDDELLDVVQAGTLTATTVTVTDSSAILGFEGVIDGKTIDLIVAESQSVETIAGRTSGNSGGAGGAIDQIIADGPSGDAQTLIDALNSLPTDQDVQDATEQLLPAITGGHAQGNVTVARAGATNIVQDRLVRIAGLNAGGGLLADPTAWVKPFAADTAQGSRGGVSGFDALTTGVAVGIDGQYTEDLRAGAAISYAQADIVGRGASNSSLDIDTVQFTGYGSYAIDRKTDLILLGAFGWNDNDSRRAINFGGLNRIAEADYDGWHAIAEAELVRSYRLSKDLKFQPSFGISYIYAEAEDYSETGAGAANLAVDDADADSLDLSASGKLTYALAKAINLSSNLGVTYDVLAGDDQVTATFEGGGGAFVTESIDPAPVGVTAGVALELVPQNGIDAVLAYDLEARDDFANHQFQLNFRLPF